MNCTRCGTPIPEESPACPSCGLAKFEQQSYAPPPPPPPSFNTAPPAGPVVVNNYLIPSILVTLCCCMPLGIVAIVFAAQVNSKLAAGDVAGAREAASKAKLFCWLAVGFGIVATVIIVIVNGAAGLFQALQHTAG
jgi:hypothetical protein